MEPETEVPLGAEEKLIVLNISLVIYLHDRRYNDALEHIEVLLNDPEMQKHREYLLLKQEGVRQDLAGLANQKGAGFLQLIFNFFHDPA